MRNLILTALLSAILPLSAFADDSGELVSGNNAFAVDLYRQLKIENGNIFFSPEGISMSLAMPYAGARGTTAEEIAKTFHFAVPQESLPAAMRRIIHSQVHTGGKVIDGDLHGYNLDIANAIWVDVDYHVLQPFLRLATDDHDSEVISVDFKNDSKKIGTTINQWAEEHTGHKIKELIEPKAINGNMQFVLTNAVYFKSKWHKPFPKEITKDEKFEGGDGSANIVPLMHTTANFSFLEKNQFKVISLPYLDQSLSMIIFLPNEAKGLAAFEDSMTAENMNKWISELSQTDELNNEVELALPKFKVASQIVSITSFLQSLGIHHAFYDADFSGIADRKTGQEPLKISEIIHKAYIDVDEKGTEAAAATSVEYRSIEETRNHKTHAVFRADHPFVFLIRDNRSGAILFMGRVVNPSIQ